MWIDSHCHLNHANIREAGMPADLAARAQEAGVDGMVSVCCRIADEFPDLLQMAGFLDNVWCTVGTHPHEAGKSAEKTVTLEALVNLANSSPKVVGIGESGLDYYYDYAPRLDQGESFRKHIRACIETDLPLVVHSRDAEADTARILREEGAGKGLRGVMHCFSSGPQLAEDALDLGFYISFSGIVTFNKSDELRAIARTVPLDRVLVETDAPYLAPMPFRGRVNEPAMVAHTGAFLADLYGMELEAFAAQTSRNFFDLFTRAALV
ncbi:MAG: TatD family hydrolase [Alphaproteobacteria bacterium]|nr:TatD family hydrolase [Alphaproteobacteria bacterium]